MMILPNSGARQCDELTRLDVSKNTALEALSIDVSAKPKVLCLGEA